MNGPRTGFDFHYAVLNTEVVEAPKKSIETLADPLL